MKRDPRIFVYAVYLIKWRISLESVTMDRLFMSVNPWVLILYSSLAYLGTSVNIMTHRLQPRVLISHYLIYLNPCRKRAFAYIDQKGIQLIELIDSQINTGYDCVKHGIVSLVHKRKNSYK